MESLQSEIYFLREETRQKNNFIATILQKNQHTLPSSSKHEDQLPDQKALAKHETNKAELENKVTEINNLTAELTKVPAIPTNVSNLNCKSISSPVVENIQHTHEIVPSISSKTAENEEEVVSKTAKEQKEISQVENDHHQAPQNKLSFIVGDSMLKDVDGYLLTGSLDKKFIVKVRPFSSAKTEDMHDYLKPTKRDFNPNVFILHVGTNNLSTNDSPEMIADKILETAESIKKEDNNVVLSAIVPRVDKLNEKAEKVNSLLEKAFNQKQIDLIMHSNINTKRHLNRSRLHLNGYGKSIFIRNIRNYLTNFK